jgi:serine/threonine protein kinase
MSHLLPGAVIAGLAGSYRIVEKRGEGGFGIAWRAERVEDGRAVLAKELKIGRLGSWKALELFEREAKTLAAIRHERIPQYHDFFATDGARALPASALQSASAPGALSLVLVQDFVAGRSLEERIAAGARLETAEVERLLRGLLEVLDHLHGLHPPVVHRDINPRNVIVRDDGAAFLVDFGAIQDALRSTDKIGSTNVGTFGFMALEQTMGRAVPASDLYALGMTVLSAVTHRAPSELPHDEATGRVKVAEAAPHLPARLRGALESMVAPIAGQRAASARAVLDYLDARAEHPGPTPRATASPPADPAQFQLERVRRGHRPASGLPFQLALAAGILAASIIHLVFFNQLSESMLVRISYYWITPIVFGASGLIARASAPDRSPWPRAVIATLAGLLLLLVFYNAVWPSL